MRPKGCHAGCVGVGRGRKGVPIGRRKGLFSGPRHHLRTAEVSTNRLVRGNAPESRVGCGSAG